MPKVLPVQQESLGDLVAQQLRALIIKGEIASGTHLVETQLSEQFGVSRGPVRDALRQLEAEDLVAPQGRSLAVVGLHDEDVDELYSLRESLETLAVRRSANRLHGSDWDVLNEPLEAMRAAAASRDAAEFAVADLAFHSCFYDLSGHRRLRNVWQQYLPTFTVLLQVTTAYDVDLGPSAQSHQLLVDLLRTGRIDEAVVELSAHLFGAGERLRAVRSARAVSSAPDAKSGAR